MLRPNIVQALKEDTNAKRSVTLPDRHIYALPFLGDKDGFSPYPKLWINQKWLTKLNLKMPETVDDLYAVLKAFKEKDPNGNGVADEIPLTASLVNGQGTAKHLDTRNTILNDFGFTDLIDVENGKVRYAPVESGYQAYAEFMKRLYADGLLDKEAFTQTVQQRNA